MPTYLDIEQLSPEWHARRRGCITASDAEKLFGKKGRDTYLRTIAAERLVPRDGLDEYLSPWMQRGIALEAEALAAIEFEFGVEVQRIGLVVSDLSPWFTCSPDALLGDSELVQIKCPAPHTHIGYLLDPATFEKDYAHQLTAELVVTGRARIHLVSYCPGLKPLIRTATRSAAERDAFAAEVSRALLAIEQIVDEVKP